MSSDNQPDSSAGTAVTQDGRVVVVGPEGQQYVVPEGGGEPQRLDAPDGEVDGAPGEVDEESDDESDEVDSVREMTSLVEEPAKVMRIGRMVQHLLEEVKSISLDEPGRGRLADVLHSSITELKDGLAPELDEELDRLIKPFDQRTPSESELRIAQAQLVGWLEGLFHGIQTAIYAQQMAARSQLEQMRRALPPGSFPEGMQGEQDPSGPGQGAPTGGMYL